MTTNNTPDPTIPDTIVLIHGLWLTPRSWEHWIDRYERLGHRVIAPTWPGMDSSIEDLRRDPSTMAGVDITEITDHYEAIIRVLLDTSPIIIGHSFAGLSGQRGSHTPEQGQVGHRVQGVPWPLSLHAGPGRLGRGRRLRP